MITAISLIEIAAKWRRENDYVGKEGVLIIYNGEVQSWVNVLRNPEHWVSGCYAISKIMRYGKPLQEMRITVH